MTEKFIYLVFLKKWNKKVIPIVSLQTLGEGEVVEKLISQNAQGLGKIDEALKSLQRNPEAAEREIHLLREQLLYLARIESLLNGKTLHIIQRLHELQGLLTAREVNLGTAYKQMKFTERTSSDQQQLKGIEEQKRKTGELIRHLEALIHEIKEIEQEIVSGTRRDLSTNRYIAEEAGRGL